MTVYKIILFLLICFSCEVKAQDVVVVNQTIEEIESYMRVKLIFDNDSVTQFELTNGTFHLDSNACLNIVDITITPIYGQPYHNQYRRDQLKFLDTIKVNQTRMIRRQTPRLFLGTDEILDSILIDQSWFGDWLDDRSPVVNGISFWVNNSSALKNSDKRKVKKVVRAYCDSIGHKEFSTKIEFKNTPYVTGQDDYFNEGTVVTDEFIQGQNTPFMMNIAQQYALVVSVIIDWKRE